VRRSGAHVHFRVWRIGSGAGLDRKLVLIETASNSRGEIRVMAPTLCLRIMNYISVKSLIRRQFPAGRLAATQSGVKFADGRAHRIIVSIPDQRLRKWRVRSYRSFTATTSTVDSSDSATHSKVESWKVKM
jgi:hypothetical protein